MSERAATFLTGSTMRHVVVMTMTGMIGLTFMFLVDAVTLFWISRLDVEANISAMGFAWSVQLFTISANVGLMIATVALVSKTMGQGRFELARKQATSSVIIAVALMGCISALLLIYREPVLRLAGAKGEVLEIASTFLLISVPSIPVMVIGMIASSVLRADGDALRSMFVTLSAGIVAMIVDPFLIFGMNLGVEGAAFGIVASRTASALLGIYFVIFAKRLVDWVSWEDIRASALPFFIIAAPAFLTQVSTPFGNYIATSVISQHGEAAVAGWAVIGRVVVVAFGGVFALSGAIGGIIGQNYGAGKFDRVRSTYRDAMIFSTAFVIVVWAILALLTMPIATAFRLTPEAQVTLRAFTYVAAGMFVFFAFIYVSNVAFNNLGHPLRSTLVNWMRDGVFMWPCCLIGSFWAAAPGVVIGQSLAALPVGVFALWWGWRTIIAVEKRHNF